MKDLKKKVLITGANSYVGKYFAYLFKDRLHITGCSRSPFSNSNKLYHELLIRKNLEEISMEDLRDIEIVIHLAARVHVFKETEQDARSAFFKINTIATESLFKKAQDANVKQFVFLSTAGVYGEKTIGKPLVTISPVAPHNFYSESKLEAEYKIQKISKETSYTIIRAPLIYGWNAPGNFQKLQNIVIKSLPLPFLNLKNKKNFLSVLNLVGFINECIDHSKSHNRVFLISDIPSYSTTDIIKSVAGVLMKNPSLFSFPPRMLQFIGAATGKQRQIDQLLNDFEIDPQESFQALGWKPSYDMRQTLSKTKEISL